MLVVKVVYKMVLNPLMDHRPFGNNGVKLTPFVFFRALTRSLKIVHLLKLPSTITSQRHFGPRLKL